MTEIQIDPHFPASYAQARERFLAASAARGARLSHHLHPLTGRQGEALAADVAVFGAADAADVLLLHSGTHGVEGHCGSGIQHALLDATDLVARAVADGVRVVLLHAINPWGFSWARRVTEDNVDLNRNFRDFSEPGGPDPDYDEVHPLLLADQWPWTDENRAAIAAFIAARGLAHFQYAVTHGQRSRPEGLFHAGNAPTWSNRTLRDVLRTHVAGAGRLFWIDVHTGLGPMGVGEMIFAGRNVGDDLANTRACWGASVTSTSDGTSSSARIGGQVGNAAYDECPGTQMIGIGLEFGTWPIERMLDALRFDHWVHLHAREDARLRDEARRTMIGTFFVDTAQWKGEVVRQGLDAVERVLAFRRG
jgi:predicted deacylase